MEDQSVNGSFSKNVLSLSLQIRTLFEGFGGGDAVKLLDRLAALSGREQRAALEVFSGVVERLLSSEERLSDEDDEERRRWEDTLYRELVDTLKQERLPNTKTRPLSVVNGGRGQEAVFMGRQLRRAKKVVELKEYPLRPRKM